MTASLRSHIADVLFNGTYGTNDQPTSRPVGNWSEQQADALLADPTLRTIIDLADWAVCRESWVGTPEVRALLAAWRAER